MAVDYEQMAREQATKDFLAQQGQPAQAPASGSPDPGFFQQYVAPAILPTVGGMIGAPAGPLGVAAGSGLGTIANDVMGIEDPSVAQIALSIGTPLAFSTAANLLRAGSRFGTAGRAAEVLNTLAPEEAAARLVPLESVTKSRDLFKLASEGGGQVKMSKALEAISEVKDSLLQSAIGQKTQGSVLKAISALENKLSVHGQSLSPRELQAELAAVGEQISTMQRQGGAGLGVYKKLFAGMIDDLDIAANAGDTPAANVLKEARNLFKRESVLREIKTATEAAMKPMRGQGAVEQFNAAAVLRDIGKNKFFTEAFTPAEQNEITGLFKMLNKIPALSPAAGQQFGSGRIAKTIAASTMGGGAGLAMGGPAGSGIGAMLGAATPSAVELAQNITTAMQMQTGRALLKQLLTNSDGAITPQIASILGAYVRAVNSEPGSAMTQ